MRHFPREWLVVYRKGGWYSASALLYLTGLLVLPFGVIASLALWSWSATPLGIVATMTMSLVCMYLALFTVARAHSKEANDAFATLLAHLNNPDKEQP